jgi:hypothetical protein
MTTTSTRHEHASLFDQGASAAGWLTERLAAARKRVRREPSPEAIARMRDKVLAGTAHSADGHERRAA